MSQHIYRNGDVEVRMGYDRPLDFVFCTVSTDDEIVYSNLDDDEAGTFQQDVEYYRGVILGLDMGIKVPEQMFTNVKQDQIDRIGNKVVQYTETGVAF